MLAALIVPCYNEANRFQSAFFLDWLGLQTEARLILVDDGSRDATLTVLERIRERFPDRVTVLPLKPNRGKAEAVRNGLLYALDTFQPDIIGFWDADLATPLDAFDRFVEVLHHRPDIEMIFGSRVKLLGRHVQRRPLRHYLGRVFATAASVMLNLAIYDTQCGAKLFVVKPHTRRIFADPFLSKWVFDVEIIARYLQIERCDATLLEKRIYEYPLETWVDIAGSKVRPSDFLTAFWDTVRIRVHYLSKPGFPPPETAGEPEKPASR
jgi:glycosyltransferase involved in cell wall biosynthesis